MDENFKNEICWIKVIVNGKELVRLMFDNLQPVGGYCLIINCINKS